MSLLDPAYLAQRARLIATEPAGASMKVAKPGTPGAVENAYATMPEQPEYGTSHMSIVDPYGNAIAMTTTIEDAFGARQMVQGFLLNNELTDFNFAPTDASGAPVANRVQPGKRPRSSMAPTLVFDKLSDKLVMTQWPRPFGGRTFFCGHGGGAAGARPRGARDQHDQWPAGDCARPGARPDGVAGRRRPTPRRCGDGRLSEKQALGP